MRLKILSMKAKTRMILLTLAKYLCIFYGLPFTLLQGRRHRGGQGGHGPPTFCKAKLLKTNFYKQNILIVNCTMGTYWDIYKTFDSRLNCAHGHQYRYQYFGKFIKPNFSWGLWSVLLVNSFLRKVSRQFFVLWKRKCIVYYYFIPHKTIQYKAV